RPRARELRRAPGDTAARRGDRGARCRTPRGDRGGDRGVRAQAQGVRTARHEGRLLALPRPRGRRARVCRRASRPPRRPRTRGARDVRPAAILYALAGSPPQDGCVELDGPEPCRLCACPTTRAVAYGRWQGATYTEQTKRC